MRLGAARRSAAPRSRTCPPAAAARTLFAVRRRAQRTRSPCAGARADRNAGRTLPRTAAIGSSIVSSTCSGATTWRARPSYSADPAAVGSDQPDQLVHTLSLIIAWKSSEPGPRVDAGSGLALAVRSPSPAGAFAAASAAVHTSLSAHRVHARGTRTARGGPLGAGADS